MPFPPSVTLVTVHGELLEIDGSPAAGTITFELTTQVRVVGDPAVIIPSRYVATLDANGEFSIQLPATNDADLELIPFSYKVTPRLSTGCSTFYVELPTSDLTVEYADLIPLAAPPTPAASYVLTSTFLASQAAQDALIIPDTIIDAKGDLIAGTAADTVARLAVGTNGFVLTADSAEATGLKWAAAGGGGIPATIFDVKGDLIAASAADTAARLAVGTNGQFLRADSAQATGLIWDTLDASDIPDLSATYIAKAFIAAKGDLIGASANDTPVVVPVGSNGAILVADSAQTPGIKWELRNLFALKTAGDQSITNNVVLADIVGLSVSVEASSIYILDLFLIYDTGATPDIQFGLVAPAGATGNWASAPAKRTADADTDFSVVSIATTLNAGGVAAGTVVQATYTGILHTSSAGTFKMQFCQATTSGTATIVKNDSYIRLTKVG